MASGSNLDLQRCKKCAKEISVDSECIYRKGWENIVCYNCSEEQDNCNIVLQSSDLVINTQSDARNNNETDDALNISDEASYSYIFPREIWPTFDYACLNAENICCHFSKFLAKTYLEDISFPKLYKDVFDEHITVVCYGDAKTRFMHLCEKRGVKKTLCRQRSLSSSGLRIFVVAKETGDLAKKCHENKKHHDTLVVNLGMKQNKDHAEQIIGHEDSKYFFDTTNNWLDSLISEVMIHIAKCLETIRNADLQKHDKQTGVDDKSGYLQDLEGHGLQVKYPDEQRKTEDENFVEHLRKVQENLDVVNQLRVRIKRLLHRLSHRSDDIPSFIREVQEIEPDLRDKVMDSIIVEDGVIGCGTFGDTFHVYIDEFSHDKEVVKNKVLQTMRKEGIPSCKLHTARLSLKEYSYIGAKIGRSRCGSLGCFARKDDDENNVSICAIVSKHVAVGSEDNHMYLGTTNNGNDIYGHIVRPLGKLDIASVAIKETDKIYLDTKFKDERGKALDNCEIFDFQNKNYVLPDCVHLWGAESKPGCGEIIVENLRLSYQPKLILFRNRADETTPLCKHGDSGAAIVGWGGGNKHFAVAILMGELVIKTDGTKVYCAVELQAGLQELSQLHKTEYKLYNEG